MILDATLDPPETGLGREGAELMRGLVLLLLLLPGWMLTAAQGLTPKAGAESDGLYTNLYFGMNYKLPADWVLSYVAGDGACERECMLLDMRASVEKTRRTITVTAEQLAAGSGQERVALAASNLEQMGAKKIAPAKEIAITRRKAYRVDYRSTLADSDVFYSVVMLIIPGKDYAVVFSFSSESRKYLDTLVDEMVKSISFVGQS
jgi:hypothetical protein